MTRLLLHLLIFGRVLHLLWTKAGELDLDRSVDWFRTLWLDPTGTQLSSSHLGSLPHGHLCVLLHRGHFVTRIPRKRVRMNHRSSVTQ